MADFPDISTNDYKFNNAELLDLQRNIYMIIPVSKHDIVCHADNPTYNMKI